jgi:peptidoglycan/LPS O-acetylase OafA/YrhL
MNSQTGILGVSLFFIVTGYLMPLMLERYSRAEFITTASFGYSQPSPSLLS